MIGVERITSDHRHYPRWQKRMLDLVVGGFASLLLLIPGLVIAGMVRLTSRGPSLFKQDRVGERGQVFKVYKFRSMYEANDGPGITAAGDKRITPLGRVLRKWKLDELPQLINVLKGDMSLVGPRPEVQEFVSLYSDEQRRVLTVPPGITGLAAIDFRNEERLLESQDDVRAFYVSDVMPQQLAIDLRYLDEASLRLDILILLRTAAAIFQR